MQENVEGDAGAGGGAIVDTVAGTASTVAVKDAPPSASGHPRTTIVAIMISIFLMGSGMGLQGSAVALRAGLEGFSDPVVGFIMSANYVGLILGSMIAPIIIRNVGYVRTFAASASLGAGSAISHLLWIEVLPWLIFRTATGFSLALMFVVAESWLNASSTSYNRGRLLSVYSIVYIVSMGAGQPVMAIFSPASFEIFGFTTLLISFCLIPITIMRVTGEPTVDREPPRLVQTFMKTPLAGSGVIVAGIMAGATWSLTPLYGQQVGMDGGAIGSLMLLVSLGSMAFQLPLGWLSDKKSRRFAILWSIGGAAFVAALIALFRPGGGMLYMLIFLYGGFGMPLYSLSLAFANDQFEPREMVRAAGAIVIYYGIGNAAGPVLGGQFMRWAGPEGLFLSMTLVLSLFIAFVFVRMTLRPAVPRRKTGYRLYPRTTASAFQLLRKVRVRRRPNNSMSDPQNRIDS